MTVQLTDRQTEALKAFAGYQAENEVAPTREELGDLLDISKVSAHALLQKLQDAECIKRDGSGWRNLKLTPRGKRLANVSPPGK